MNNLNLEGITYGSRDEKPTTSHQEANDDTKVLIFRHLLEVYLFFSTFIILETMSIIW